MYTNNKDRICDLWKLKTSSIGIEPNYYGLFKNMANSLATKLYKIASAHAQVFLSIRFLIVSLWKKNKTRQP